MSEGCLFEGCLYFTFYIQMSDAINALLFRNCINVVVTQDHESQIMRPITLAIVCRNAFSYKKAVSLSLGV